MNVSLISCRDLFSPPSFGESWNDFDHLNMVGKVIVFALFILFAYQLTKLSYPKVNRLYEAVNKNNLEQIKAELLKNPKEANQGHFVFGQTPAELAVVDRSDPEIIEAIIDACPLVLQGKNGRQLIHLAILNSDLKVIKLIIRRGGISQLLKKGKWNVMLEETGVPLTKLVNSFECAVDLYHNAQRSENEGCRSEMKKIYYLLWSIYLRDLFGRVLIDRPSSIYEPRLAQMVASFIPIERRI